MATYTVVTPDETRKRKESLIQAMQRTLMEMNRHLYALGAMGSIIEVDVYLHDRGFVQIKARERELQPQE